MKKIYSILLFLLAAACTAGGASKTYHVNHYPQATVKIDGVLAEPEWQKANTETEFDFPWEKTDPPKTEFRAFYSADSFYFSFVAVDDNIVVAPNIYRDEDIIAEDRVEMYFTLNPDLNEYYCLEVNPVGRALTYAAAFPRILSFEWNWPGLVAKGTINDNGYVVEGAFPLASFAELGFPIKDKKPALHVALFRAEFTRVSDYKVDEHWLSWINPDVQEPDFHVPSSFGTFIFEK